MTSATLLQTMNSTQLFNQYSIMIFLGSSPCVNSTLPSSCSGSQGTIYPLSLLADGMTNASLHCYPYFIHSFYRQTNVYWFSLICKCRATFVALFIQMCRCNFRLDCHVPLLSSYSASEPLAE